MDHRYKGVQDSLRKRTVMTHYLQNFRLSIFVVIALVGAQSSAFAAGPGYLLRTFKNSSLFLSERQPTLAPFAHVKFCMTTPDQCAEQNGPKMITLTKESENQMRAINTTVNDTIEPLADPVGFEEWKVDAVAGSCHDYAVTKRKMLIDAGWSANAVRIAVAKTASGEGHAVVVVRTNRGDLVLDNRTKQIKRWNRTDLTWIKIESSDNPRLWFAL